MFNPCRDHCYFRYGKQYTPECDSTCEYAKVVKENKELKLRVDDLCGSIRLLERELNEDSLESSFEFFKD